MKIPKLTKKQVQEVLKETPLEVLLMGKDHKRLTKSQLDFCKHKALGLPSAKALRQAYPNRKSKPQTMANDAYRMMKRPDIINEIEAIKTALEFQRIVNRRELNSLTVHRLYVEATNEDNPPSVRVQALKTLGTVVGVDAFVHRSETVVHKSSDSIKTELMIQLKQAMQGNTIDMDDDAQALLDEINPPARTNGLSTAPPQPDPPFPGKTESQPLHSNPHKQSHDFSKDANIPQQNQGLPEQVSTLTVDLPAEEGVGVAKKQHEWREDPIGKTPVIDLETKG
jgi:hypothetical protein